MRIRNPVGFHKGNYYFVIIFSFERLRCVCVCVAGGGETIVDWSSISLYQPNCSTEYLRSIFIRSIHVDAREH